MKLVGLVTLFRNNYGSILQCYATKSFLESMGYCCNVIEYQESGFSRKILRLLRLGKHLFRSIVYQGYFKSWTKKRKSLKEEQALLSLESKEKMDLFVLTKLQPIQCQWKCCKKIGKEKDYIAFITGSDQVWNASTDILPTYFLKFAPRYKRIAFAPSFGTSSIAPFNLGKVKRGLLGFNSLSVREKQGVNLIDKCCDRRAELIADPVILLSAAQWKNVENHKAIPAEEYILVHFLNAPNEYTIKNINALLQQMNCRCICLAYSQLGYDRLENAAFFDGGPEDYLSLIENASAICTDSFHTTLFSIIFNKEFWTFERQYLHSNAQNSRIENLLDMVGMPNRLSKSGDVICNERIDYAYANRIIDCERKKAMAFLERELSCKESH